MPTVLMIDGKEFPFPDFDSLTFRESNTIKKLTGLRMGDMVQAFDTGDTDVIVALAIIAKSRQGELGDPEELYDLPIGKIEAVMLPDPVDEDEPERPDPTLPNDDESDVTPQSESGNGALTSTTVTT